MEKEQDINFSHFKGNLTRKPILFKVNLRQ